MKKREVLLPSDVIVARHGRYPTNLLTTAVGEQAMNVVLPSADEDALIGLDEIGRGQAGNLGGHIANLFPGRIALCMSSDFTRVRESAGIALPGVLRIVTKLLRERDRGDVARMPKPLFEELYPAEIIKKKADPRGWLPPNGERLIDKAAAGASLLPVLGKLAPDEPVVLMTSGEVVISARTLEPLGNMDNTRLLEGLGPEWPALSVGNADFDIYSRRDPQTGELGPTFDYMLMAQGGREELVQSGWVQIAR
jgi:broad specificity phosphatase PhoE